MAILIAAAVLSLSAQVAEARPTVGGWISAAVPALAFLGPTKLILSRPAPTTGDASCNQNQNQAGTQAPTTTGTTTPDGSKSPSGTTALPAEHSPEAPSPTVRHSYATAGRNAKIDWKALSTRMARQYGLRGCRHDVSPARLATAMIRTCRRVRRAPLGTGRVGPRRHPAFVGVRRRERACRRLRRLGQHPGTQRRLPRHRRTTRVGPRTARRADRPRGPGRDSALLRLHRRPVQIGTLLRTLRTQSP